MYTLYHHPACPFCRCARIVLAEKGMDFRLEVLEPWKDQEDILHLNPAGKLPILINPAEEVICGYRPICNYINELATPPLLPNEYIIRAEIRWACDWFDENFYHDVTLPLSTVRIYSRLFRMNIDAANLIRKGHQNREIYLGKFEQILGKKDFAGSDEFSLADVSAGAQISILDYCGEAGWDAEKYPRIYEWYGKIKSRPSFQKLLTDQIGSIIPSKTYANLDF